MDELFLVSGREHSLWSLLHVALPVARESNGEACLSAAGRAKPGSAGRSRDFLLGHGHGQLGLDPPSLSERGGLELGAANTSLHSGLDSGTTHQHPLLRLNSTRQRTTRERERASIRQMGVSLSPFTLRRFCEFGVFTPGHPHPHYYLVLPTPSVLLSLT